MPRCNNPIQRQRRNGLIENNDAIFPLFGRGLTMWLRRNLFRVRSFDDVTV
jgi:hypothetical protein